jgi:hypothetical protein
MTHLRYIPIERGPIADEANWKYFFPLQDAESLPVLILPDFLPQEEFLRLRTDVDTVTASEALKGRSATAGVTVKGGTAVVNETKIIEDVRSTKILPVHPAAIGQHTQRIQRAIREYWKVDSPVDPVHGWQCLLYEVGGHYRWHSDAFCFRGGKWQLFYPKRSFALVFCMNDWTHGYPRQNQFSGGELVFTHIVDQYNNRLTVYPRSNTLIIFPTTFHHLHQVNQVREGRRVTFVNWWGDPAA